MEEIPGEPEHSATEWEIIKELVYQWETDQPEDLDAWLTDHCPSVSLRQEVERLVRASATAGDFMQGGAAQEHFGVAASHPVHIGRYRVIEELGAGGLGVVYAAYDHALERKVAIKVLADKVAAASDRSKRLRWDAKAASAAKHPNIVVIYDIGNDAGSDYIVMECVEGLPLGKLIPPGGLPAQTVLKYALQIADALEAAHQSGIIHRDLKPNNIMIANNGVVKLLDFGLAKHDDPSAEHTSLPSTIEGHFAGTVAYVSPEQAEGKPVDNRGDIFSFGCILFEMLTGEQAFHGHNAFSVLANIINRQAPSLLRVVPQLDQRFEAIVQRCLLKQPGERFATIGEVKAQLAELVETRESPSKFSYRTRKLLVRWGIAACAAAFLAMGVMQVALWRARPKASQFDQLRVTADAGLSTYPAVSRDGRLIAFASDRAGNGNLDLWLRHWELDDARPLTSNAADEYSPAFNPAGSELVYRSEQDGGGLYRISTLGGEGRLLAPGGRDGRFSADGHWIAYWKGEIGASLHRGCAKIYIIPANGGQPEDFLPGFDVSAYPVWSATGDKVIFLGRKAGEAKGDWWVAGLQDRTAHRTGALQAFPRVGANPPIRSYFPVPAAWLGDRTVLFTAKNRDAINIWAVRIKADGTVLDEAHHWTDGTEAEDYPDGVIPTSGGLIRSVYAALTTKTAIWRIPVNPADERSGEPEPMMEGLMGLGSPSVSYDGAKLAFLANQGVGNSVQIAYLGLRQKALPATIQIGSFKRVVLSGDGGTVAFWHFDHKGYIMAVRGDAPEQICSHCGPTTDLSFDGKKAIFEGGTSAEELLLCARGQQPRVLFQIPEAPHWLQSGGRFSPDQRWVVFSGWHEGDSAKQILIVPATSDGVVPANKVVPITNDQFSNKVPA
jgi:predicted Ser/Thr protein kinase